MKIYLLFLLLFSCSLCFAQRITGVVMNPENAPIEFANVLLFNATDSTYITGAVSDEEGKFVINIPQGKNISSTMLKVSCLGYETVWKKPKSQPMHITLNGNTLSINEVVINGKAPSYNLTDEGITTNVAGTTLSILGSGMDVLTQIPSVFKGTNGIEVIGKGTPLIYINGRKVLNSGEIEILKSEDIKSVEVITSPGAKYDSEVNSVIKIKTKRAIGDGFSIGLRSNYWQGKHPYFSDQVLWNYRKGGLDIFGNHYFKKLHYYREADHTTTTRADTLWHQAYRETSNYYDFAYMNNFGFNYQLNKSSSIGAKYTIWLYPKTNSNNFIQTKAFANDELYDEMTTNNAYSTSKSPQHQANIYYQGQIGKVTIGFDADHLHNHKESENVYNEQSKNLDSRTFETYNMVRNNLFAAKLTAGFKVFAANVTIGTEFTSSKQDNVYTNSKGYVDSSECTIKEKHLSPFIETKWKLPTFSLTAGLRYEYVWSDYSSNGKHIDEQSRNYGNLYPDISLSTTIGKAQLRLSYTAKTRRPTYWQLRSGVSYGNRYNYQSGNPSLDQELQHNITLSAVWKFIQFSADYKDRRNAIIYWKNCYKNFSSITYTTFRNINSLKRAYLMVALSPQIGIWSSRFSMYLNKQWFNLTNNDEEIKMNAPYVSISFSNTLNCGKGWNVLANMNYQSKGDNENIFYSRNRFYTDVYVLKSLMNKHFTVQVGVLDVFHSRKTGTNIHYPKIVTTQTEWKDERQFFISLRYNFNTAKSKYKGTGAGNSEKNRM